MSLYRVSDAAHDGFLVNTMGSYFEKGSYVDAKFVCRGNKIVHAHKLVLTSVCPVIKSFHEEHGWKDHELTIYLPDFDSAIVNFLMTFIYEGCMRLNKKEWDEFIELCNALGMEFTNAVVTVITKKPPKNPVPSGEVLHELSNNQSESNSSGGDPKERQTNEPNKSNEDVEQLTSEVIIKNEPIDTGYLLEPSAIQCGGERSTNELNCNGPTRTPNLTKGSSDVAVTNGSRVTGSDSVCDYRIPTSSSSSSSSSTSTVSRHYAGLIDYTVPMLLKKTGSSSQKKPRNSNKQSHEKPLLKKTPGSGTKVVAGAQHKLLKKKTNDKRKPEAKKRSHSSAASSVRDNSKSSEEGPGRKRQKTSHNKISAVKRNKTKKS